MTHSIAIPTSAAPTASHPLLDAAYQSFANLGPSMGGGFIDHGPMAVEALEALGQSEAIEGFAKEHLKSDVTQAPPQTARITPDDWSDALGQPKRYSDWVRALQEDLKAMGWKALARQWIVRLTPGATAAALHGLIRTAHAVRALERQDTSARQDELVRALACWASFYGTPPWPAVAGNGDLTPGEAFAAITPAPVTQRAPQGSIAAGLGHAMHAPDFANEVARMGKGSDLTAASGSLLRHLAPAFLREARSGYTAIVWCHAITATVSVRRLARVVSVEEAQTLFTRVFEAACAMKAAFADLHADHDPGADAGHSQDDLIQRALKSGDDHAIKLVDALLDVYATDPDPIFLLAADRAVRMLGA